MSSLPEFTEEQWEFLAVLKVFDRPVTAQIAGVMAPLTPGPLFDLIERAVSHGIMERDEGGVFSLKAEIDEAVEKRLETAADPDKANIWLDRLRQARLSDEVDPLIIVRLLEQSGFLVEASSLEMDYCRQAVESGRLEEARGSLTLSLNRLEGCLDDTEAKQLFVSGALELSNLCFSLWQGLIEIAGVLDKAHEIAAELGDRRSHAMINLHLGRLFFYTDRRAEALIALSSGFEEVEELGDDDIIYQSAFFFGLHYMIQGQHSEAVLHFERAEQQFLQGDQKTSITPNALILLPYCLTYIGQYHRAVGSLESNLRLALEKGDRTLASTLEAALGSLLVLLGKKREGLYHLNKAEREAIKVENAFGRYLAGGSIGHQYFLDGRLEKAFELAAHNLRLAGEAGLIRQFTSPWVLEQAYEFQRLGFESLPEFNYEEVFKSVLEGPNIYLEGVVLRLTAREMMARGGDRKLIRERLARSEKALEKAGDPIQLSKTILETARLELLEGNRDRAGKLARRAWRELGGYRDHFFPDEFRELLTSKEQDSDEEKNREDIFKHYLQMLDALLPVDEEKDVLSRVVKATNRFYGAERGALFWFPEDKSETVPELRAACNLTGAEVGSPDFKPNMDIVLACFRENQPIIVRAEEHGPSTAVGDFRAVLCIPIFSRGAVRGVLYHDNYYLNDAFDSLDRDMIMEMTRHMNLFLERVVAYLRIRDQAAILDSAQSLKINQSVSEPIVAESQVVRTLLKQADQAARSESSILILGETGTGKELLAARVHQNSARSNKPFIVVDAAAIPEKLVESELFGHEKGAFTGADKRRIGRLEMANQGTLFLDEVGELSLDIQAKLLRALQEKTFYRVGGAKVIQSDFRLIAATNRNLAAEVAAGNFREDLFYRLNVIPLELPALRKRGEDVVRLADHYLKLFAKKHRKGFPGFSAAQKNMLLKYNWPGNIRELINIIERAVILSSGAGLELALPAPAAQTTHPFMDHPTMDELQRRYIKYILDSTGGKIGGAGGAAEILGMKRPGLYARMKKLGMRD